MNGHEDIQHKNHTHNPTQAAFLRNFIFGVEDSLVSTVGLLSGIAVAGTPAKTIILAGIVLIFVEAFAMGVGDLLSDNSAAEFTAQDEVPLEHSYKKSLIMFVSYFVAGFIPLAPYLFLEGMVAFWTSIGVSLCALFLLGAGSARVSHTRMFRHGLEMLVIGGVAIALGVLVGSLVHTFA